MQDQRNLFLAVALSLLVLFAWETLMPKRAAHPPQPAPVSAPAPQAAQTPTAPPPSRSDALAEAPRIVIDTPRLRGSLSLAGGRIDDLVLVDYFDIDEATKKKTPHVLLSPGNSTGPFYVEFGWSSEDNVPVPTAQTVWTGAADQKLTPNTSVTLTWDNGAGLTFTRIISVDWNYLFTEKQTVTNHGTGTVTLRPYGTMVRLNPKLEKASFRPATSVAGYYGAGLEEVSYSDLAKKGPVENQATNGWVGMNDSYWLIAAVPPKDQPMAFALRDAQSGDANRYSAGYQGGAVSVAPGASAETTSLVFAGAKEQKLLDDYMAANGIGKLDRTVDFGWLWYLARPFSFAIHTIAQYVGNFGVAILLFNVLLKIILFPLQDRSFHQMARMRDLQPKIAQLKERFGDDREKMAQAQMELFKKEKVNPASGCLPIFIQLPIFYALYRVLSTTIEMRQAPFFGWIHDLSAPDPTTIWNLFGLIPWDAQHSMPDFLNLGVWPLIYGATMYLQQRMTPTPTTDPAQARIMAMMPLVFMFFFARFPAGLTIYYSWNAVLTIGQMELIRRRSAQRKALAAANKA